MHADLIGSLRIGDDALLIVFEFFFTCKQF